MENQNPEKVIIEDSVEALDANESRMYKSSLFKAAQHAQKIFDYLGEGIELEEWMKGQVLSACEELSAVCESMEYNKAYPENVENLPDPANQENNFLSNEDKRYPLPQEAESTDQFMSRCIYDANMKNRYPEQSDRFMACMLILNSPIENNAENPGEKFEDPMDPKKEDIELDPVKPVLP